MSSAMSERQLQENVLTLASNLGVVAYHTYDSRRSEPGFPDLVLVGSTGVLYRELKSATGRLSGHQQFWLAALTAAGEDAEVWRPSDWPDRIVNQLQRLGRVSAQRPLPTQAEIRRRLQKKC